MELSLILMAFLAIALVLVAILAVLVWGRGRAAPGGDLAPRLEALTAAQNEIAGRFAQALAGQSELQNVLAVRLEAIDKRLGEGLADRQRKRLRRSAASRPG